MSLNYFLSRSICRNGINLFASSRNYSSKPHGVFGKSQDNMPFEPTRNTRTQSIPKEQLGNITMSDLMTERKQARTQSVSQASKQESAEEAHSLYRTFNKGVQFNWGDKNIATYDWVWLRDQCRCSQCVSSSGQKLQRIETWNPPSHTAPASISSGANDVTFQWYDGHTSTFDLPWLRTHAYGVEALERKTKAATPALWDKAFIQFRKGLPTIYYDDVLNADSSLHQLLQALNLVGVVIVKGAPIEKGVVLKLCDRIAYPERTMYGLSWDVESIPNPNNVAYTSLALPLHQDLCYYEKPPGLQLLHCIKFEQKTGGVNTFIDGFKAAQVLMDTDLASYNLLTQVPTKFHKNDGTNHLEFSHPIIELSHRGSIKHINWSPPFEGIPECDEGYMARYYRARSKFAHVVENPDLAVQHRLSPGEIVVFNNRRVMHARTAFDENEGHRLLEGAYIGSDEWASKLRVLQRQFDASGTIKRGVSYSL